MRMNSGSPMECWAMSQAASAPSGPARSSAGQPCWVMSSPRRAAFLIMNGFHAGMRRTTEFVGGEELFAEVQVVGTKREEFAAERLVEHERDVPQGSEGDEEVRFKMRGRLSDLPEKPEQPASQGVPYKTLVRLKMTCSGSRSAAKSGIVEVERVALAGCRFGAHGDNVKLVLRRQIARFEGDQLPLEMAQEFEVQYMVELLIGGAEEQRTLFGDGAR